jgi:hypothetical protein
MCEMVKVVESNNRRLPTHRRHHPPPGRRNAPPDDRLQRMIQYSAALRFYLKRRRLLDAPQEPVIGRPSGRPVGGHDAVV